jgi:hypothetical protein
VPEFPQGRIDDAQTGPEFLFTFEIISQCARAMPGVHQPVPQRGGIAALSVEQRGKIEAL